jgi:hypothetical protein
MMLLLLHIPPNNIGLSSVWLGGNIFKPFYEAEDNLG